MYNSKLDSFTNLKNQVPHRTNIGNYNDTVDEVLFWKLNLVRYNNKVINCYNIPFFHVYSDASNTGIACVFEVRGKRNMIENPPACIKLGDKKRSILGSPVYQGYFITILMRK